MARTAPLLILLLFLCPLSALANDACLSVRVLHDRNDIPWQMQEVPIPEEYNWGRIAAADLEGRGSKQLLIRSKSNSLLIVDLSKSGEVPTRTLTLPTETKELPEMVAMPVAGQTQDSLELFDEHTLIGYYLAGATTLEGSQVWTFLRTFQTPSDRKIIPQNHAWNCWPEGVGGLILQYYPQYCGPGSNCYQCLAMSNDRLRSLFSTHIGWNKTAASGTGDIDGDGIEELLGANESRNSLLALDWLAAPQHWAEIPMESSKGILHGDFNGDSLADAIVYGGPLDTAWIAYSTGNYGIERSISWPFPETAAPSTFAVGDFNGDGLDDIATFHAELKNGILRVATNKPLVPATDTVSIFAIQEERSQVLPIPFPLRLQILHESNISEEKTICGFLPGKYSLLFRPENLPDATRTVSLQESPVAQVTLVTKRSTESTGIGAAFGFGVKRNEPKVCVGYLPTAIDNTHHSWGIIGRECPPDCGFYASMEGPTRDKRLNWVAGVCCPFPADDILIDDDFIVVEKTCPEGYITTGSSPLAAGTSEPRNPFLLRCTAVNQTRYMLGARKRGKYWGDGYSGRDQAERLQLSDFPPAIRGGIARRYYGALVRDGCVGSPIGSVLVDASAKYCRDSAYQQLQYRGLPGDPPKGTPVQMFPKCTKLENEFDPASGCISEELGR